jgi:hypothetical protein
MPKLTDCTGGIRRISRVWSEEVYARCIKQGQCLRGNVREVPFSYNKVAAKRDTASFLYTGLRCTLHSASVAGPTGRQAGVASQTEHGQGLRV